MKTTIPILLACLFLSSPSAIRAEKFSDAHRFLFHAVLEGCFEDGLSTEEVSQILLRPEKQDYAHFIYACPICMPTIHALEVYRSRPTHFFGLKNGASTFGAGLSEGLRNGLQSEKPEERLEAINTLVQNWVEKRMSQLKLTPQERARLKESLEKMRKEGMKHLEGTDPATLKKSAFANVRQCAICNGACGMGLRP